MICLKIKKISLHIIQDNESSTDKERSENFFSKVCNSHFRSDARN